LDILCDLGIDDTLFYDINFPVQNVTAEEGEEAFPSLTEDLLGELDELFPEEFMNLGTMPTESNMNSFNTDPITDHMYHENIWTFEHSAEIDTTMVFNDIAERSTSTSFLEGHVDNIVSGVSVNDLSLEDLGTSFSSEKSFEPNVLSRDDSSSTVVQGVTLQVPSSLPNQSPVDTTIVTVLDKTNVKPNGYPSACCLAAESNPANHGVPEPSLELDYPSGVVPEMSQSLPVGTNVEPNSSKRPLEEDSNSVESIVPASKKKKGQCCRCTDEETVLDKIVEKEKSSSSRVRGPSKIVRLSNQEKKLEKENKELNAKVQELSASVEFLRNYIVSKLKGQCYFCKK
jgi:hypothetical protein